MLPSYRAAAGHNVIVLLFYFKCSHLAVKSRWGMIRHQTPRHSPPPLSVGNSLSPKPQWILGKVGPRQIHLLEPSLLGDTFEGTAESRHCEPMLCHVMLCHIKSRHGMSYQYAVEYYIRYITSSVSCQTTVMCHIELCPIEVIAQYVTLWDVLSLDVMSH